MPRPASPASARPTAVADGFPVAGRDEIVLSGPGQDDLCQDRGHRDQGRPAEVIVTFGQLADPGSFAFSPDAFWPGCWDRSFPMCGECWARTRALAGAARPRLAIRQQAAGR